MDTSAFKAKTTFLTLIILLVAGISPRELSGQSAYLWERTGLLVELSHLDTAITPAMVEEDEEGLFIYTDSFDFEILYVSTDSISSAIPDTVAFLLSAITIDYDLIVLNEPFSLPYLAKSSALICLDTFAFTDTVLVAAFPSPDQKYYLLVTIDCYEIPVMRGINTLKSLRFREAIPAKETPGPEAGPGNQ